MPVYLTLAAPIRPLNWNPRICWLLLRPSCHAARARGGSDRSANQFIAACNRLAHVRDRVDRGRICKAVTLSSEVLCAIVIDAPIGPLKNSESVHAWETVNLPTTAAALPYLRIHHIVHRVITNLKYITCMYVCRSNPSIFYMERCVRLWYYA